MLGSLAPWWVKSLGDYAQKRRHQASREQVAEGWINLVKGLAKIAIVGVAIWT